MNETTSVTANEVQPTTPAAQPQQSIMFGSFIPLILILGIVYFMVIRPTQRKEKERRKMIDELRAGAKVIFAGGLIGTIVEANEKSFIIETLEGRMEVVRSAVQGVVGAEEPAK